VSPNLKKRRRRRKGRRKKEEHNDPLATFWIGTFAMHFPQ